MLLNLEQFGFRALWSPYFLVFLLLLLFTFIYFGTRKRHIFEGEEPLRKKELYLFTFSLFLVYIVKGSPLDLIGHFMFTFHMIQMALLYLLVPPLVIVSVPGWMWKKILSFPVVKGVFKLFTKPVAALLLFNGMFSFYHIPIIFDTVKTNIMYHAVYSILLFVAATFMWWPLVNKVDDYHHLTGLKKVAYLFADSVLITPACALIIFNNTPLFDTYVNTELWIQSLQLCVPPDVVSDLNLAGPEMFNFMPPLHDQQAGGVIMKVLQELIYGVVLYRVLAEWFRNEEKDRDFISSMKKQTMN